MRVRFQRGILVAFSTITLVLISHAQSANVAVRNREANAMETIQTVEGYYNALRERAEYESFMSEDIVFTSYTSPVKTVQGKDAFLKSSKPFYSSITSMEVRDVLVEGERACALTHYELRGPKGAFSSDVAEILTVKNGKISSLAIYFDGTPFPK